MPHARPTRFTRRTAALAAIPPRSTRELPTDPIRDNSSDDGVVMPQSQIQSIDDAPNADFEFRPRNRIFPLDDDGDEVLDEEIHHVAPRPRKRRIDKHVRLSGMRNGFKGVDSLLGFRTRAMEKGEPPSPVVKRRRSRRSSTANFKEFSSDSDERLQELIDKSKTDEEVAELKAAWATPAGRRKVRSLRDSSSEDEDTPPSKKRKTRRRLRQGSQPKPPPKSRSRSRSKSHTIDISDDFAHAVDSSTDTTAGDTRKKSRSQTRRGKSRQTPQPQMKSVPLPKNNGSLVERLHSRGPVPNATRRTGRVTRASAAATKESRARDKENNMGTRRSSRLMSAATSDSEQELDGEGEEPEAADSDYSEDGEEEEISIMEEELVAEDDDEASADSDFIDPDPEPPRKNKRRKAAKKNDRRKRTRPKNAFESNADQLSAREQRQRLDFLVKQSADIARDLHKAMADAANERPGSGPKSPARKADSPATEGDAAATNAAVDPSQGTGEPYTPPAEEKFVLPNAEGKELQPHQTDGVNWLLTLDAQGLNAILADEMGLGKTIQAVAFLASLVISGKRGPHLVIAPKNVCEHWAAEVRGWYPGQINVVTHLGNAEERLENLHMILEEDNFDIMVTSFEIALRDLITPKRYEGIFAQYSRVLRAFRKVEFEYLIVDEAHRLKNDASRINRGIRNYRCAQRRLLLTGTPLSNDLKELWSLMNVLNPKIFSSKATFEAWFSAPFQSGKGSRKGIMTHTEQSVIVDRLHTVIRPFFRRRVRADVCPSFTSADEILIRCPMSQLQRALMLHFRRRADDKDASKNNILMAMRGVSSHPFLSSCALYDGEQSQANVSVVSNCGKFTFLHYSLPRLLAGGHRVLIFSQFRRALDFLEDLMDLLGIAYGRLDGLTTSEDRLAGLQNFNAPGSKLQVFLLSTRAGGVGINLQTADTVILFDSDWNPSADLQAVSRIQRIGQKKTVHIMRLVTEKSVDNIILETSKRKLRTQKVAVGAGKFNTSSGAALDQKMRQQDLEKLLQELDIKAFLPVDIDEEQDPGPPSQSSPESVSPNRPQRSQPAKYFKEWAKQLLRPGETELPDIDQPAVWIDSAGDGSGSGIPIWLGKDANLVAAGKALECMNLASADHVFEQTLQSIARVGAFSKKDRASRARRNVIADLGSELGSDSDDQENVSEGDPSVSVEECSDVSEDEEFVPEGAIDEMSAISKLGQSCVPSPPQPHGIEDTPSRSLAPPSLHNPASSLATPSYKPSIPLLPVDNGAISPKPDTVPQPSDRGRTQHKRHRLQQQDGLEGDGNIQPGRPVRSPAQPTKSTLSRKQIPIASADSRNPMPRTKKSSHAKIQTAPPVLNTPITHEFYVGHVATGFVQRSVGGGNTGSLNPLHPRSAIQPILPLVAVPRLAVPANVYAQSQWSGIDESRGFPLGSSRPRQNVPVPARTTSEKHPEDPHHTVPKKLTVVGGFESGSSCRQTAKVASAGRLPWHTQEARLSLAPAPTVVGCGLSPGSSYGIEQRPTVNQHVQAKIFDNMPTGTMFGASHTSKARVSLGQLERVKSPVHTVNTALLDRRVSDQTQASRDRRSPVRLLPRVQHGASDQLNTVELPVQKGKIPTGASRANVVLGRRYRATQPNIVAKGTSSTNATHAEVGLGAGISLQNGTTSGQASDGRVNLGRHYRTAQSSIFQKRSSIASVTAVKETVQGSRVKVPAVAKIARPPPVVGARVAQRLAPVQTELADQGSPSYSRNPRTLCNRPSSPANARNENSLSLSRAKDSDRIYSASTLDAYVRSLGNSSQMGDVKAECFGNLVKQLQDATKVNDIDFLTDALLECRCNIDDAADYVYDRIS